ncbi:MAG TPA: type IV toxin-antitoxin system AbiEi family antitoxin domain-containing protein [Solirubrobacterales bacterium]|nr:type IV toxin-antitoxin system AbiEi family antitoxin domain-containing protein [Solirubrobacterales bacterium]
MGKAPPLSAADKPSRIAADGPQAGQIVPFAAHRPKTVGRERVIAEIADRQHGVATLAQLRDAGLSASGVRKRVAKGRLYAVHAGVYSVGRRLLTPDGRRIAAVLACGPGAVLSHRSAAALWGLCPDSKGSIDVTAPNRRGRIPAGIAAHRDGSLHGSDRTSIRGIPCSSVARTLLDLAGMVSVSELRREISQAEVLRIFDLAAVEALIGRSRGRRGVARLRMIISELSPRTGRTRSYLERRFLAMCERAMIPPPEVNCKLDLGNERLTPDFLWRDTRLIVETDGRETHDTASAFEEDRRRDQVFGAAGWQVIRCTWRQVLDEPARVASTISTVLASTPRRRA